MDAESDEIHGNQEAWTQEEVKTVINNIVKAVGNDSFGDIKKLDWSSVKTEGRDKDDCKSMFYKLTHRIRKYRTVNEILSDLTDLPRSVLEINAKKRPISAFLMFASVKDKEIRKKNPKLSRERLRQKIRNKWDKSEEIQAIYKAKYDEELKKFRESREDTETLIAIGNSKLSPFSVFYNKKCSSAKEENPSMDSRQLRSFLKKKYNDLSAKKKYHFMKKALQKLAEYKEKCEEPKKDDMDLHLTKEENNILLERLKKPQSVPRNSYLYFCTKERPKLKDLSMADQSKQLAAIYSKLDQDGKAVYETEYKESISNHIEELKEYKKRLAPWSKTMTDSVAEDLIVYEKILNSFSKKKRKRKVNDIVKEEEPSPKKKKVKDMVNEEESSPKKKKVMDIVEEEDSTPKKKKVNSMVKEKSSSKKDKQSPKNKEKQSPEKSQEENSFGPISTALFGKTTKHNKSELSSLSSDQEESD